MALAPGTRLGTYEVIAPLGEGGMGQVYRARDTRLQRHVAIKVLPDSFSADEGRRARFEREARALAALNHPNIAVIYGLEELPSTEGTRDGQSALVMELVEGETLDNRLRRGRVALAEALHIAEQIADALSAAHEKGIVHRDLKPANVMITASGAVKLLDFGIAKIFDAAASAESTSPTLTLETHIVGTPAYMAPEQAQGRPVDKRADVWAFGVLLTEMLTGLHPFARGSAQETLAAVLTSEPDWQRIPTAVQPVLRACLQRDPSHRLRDLGDVRFVLRAAPDTAAVSRSRSRVPLLAAAGITALLAIAAFVWIPRRAEPSVNPIRLATMLPQNVAVTRGPGYTSSVAVSPDGLKIAIAGMGPEGQALYVRPLDRLDAVRLAGTDRASSPFFSADGAWIGFFADGRLQRIPVDGGAAVDIAPAPGLSAGASWGDDNRIVFAYGADPRLHVVSPDGADVDVLENIESARHPEVVPDGRTILYESGGWIEVIDRNNGRRARVIQGTAPRYAMGHVTLIRGTTLLAVPFDLSRYETTGPAVPLVENVAVELPGSGGGRHYALSPSGTLAYVPAARAYSLVLLQPNGIERAVTEPQPTLENPRFSPDGRQILFAARRRGEEPADLWVHDLENGSSTQLTFDGGRAPVWTPDGMSVAYSHLGEGQGIYRKRSDGRGEPERLVSATAFHWLVGWTPDQRMLSYGVMSGNTSSIQAFDGKESRTVVEKGPTWGGRLSRDGKWLAYYLLESGVFHVYVTPFPEGGARWVIADGTDPAWAPDGSEIYYRSGTTLMAARIAHDNGVRALSRRVVYEPFLPPLYDDYDIHPDGRTLALVRPANDTQGREVLVVVNWLAELRRMVGGR